ncbi:MAG: glutamine--fructose-6-phosphate transaminase (isomerizing) [Chloroflexia bacterium]|nr:glutamine--fructose-6-phosphate transaminase (isomerizing) [Chloroflexia bacterium]
MCGIFGYVGPRRDVAATVGSALRALEYRGYDSWGMVWRGKTGLRSVKEVGRVPTGFAFDDSSGLAVGHTRWATHGEVTTANAHPHLDCLGRIAVVHNGIVENAPALKRSLRSSHIFMSETDSEVIVHLLEEQVNAGATLLTALRRVFPRLEGQNAVIAIDQRNDEIVGVMNVSPLVIGMGTQSTYIASDPYVLGGMANQMTVVPNHAFVRLMNDTIEMVDASGAALDAPAFEPVPSQTEEKLGAHPHYMAKEMSEQPDMLDAQLEHDGVGTRLAERLGSADTVVLTGCGSAYFAARIGASWLTGMAGKRAIPVPASEFMDLAPFIGASSRVLGISQSGETADLLHALRTARELQSPTTALVNVMHSSAVRLAGEAIPLDAGRERSVLATKSLLAMLGRLLVAAGTVAGRRSEAETAVRDAANAIRTLLASESFHDDIERVVAVLAARPSILVIGNGVGVGVAQETALKLKEASYIHAEAFAAGELKHGAIALVEQGTPCLVFASDPELTTDMESAAQELKSRGGHTVGIGFNEEAGLSDSLKVPSAGMGTPLVHVFVAQSLAYRLAIHKGLDPDFPRNLAKSVTVR